MNKKTVLACAIIGALTNGQPVLAEKFSGERSYAVGKVVTNPSKQSVAVGVDSESTGVDSLAVGNKAKSSGYSSVSIGVDSGSKGDYSLAAGGKAKSPGHGSVSIGVDGKSEGDYSLAVGGKAKSIGSHSVAVGAESESEGDYSVAAGGLAKSLGESSVAVGEQSESIGHSSLALGLSAIANEKDSLALGSASKANRKYDEGKLKAIWAEQDNKLNSKKIREVSLGVFKGNDEDTVLGQITHVAPGIEDTDAVNFYQLKKVKRDVDERIGEVDKIKTTKNNVERLQDEAKNTLDTTVKHRDNAYNALIRVKVHEESADSIVKRLKKEASLIEGEITQNSDGPIYIGKELKGSQIFVSGKQGDRVISGVASGVKNSDAVNVSQLNTVRTTANYASQLAQKNNSRINYLEDRLSKTNTKIERGLATSAALTGLFQPYGVGKVNFTASIGGYGASQALAVGAGYRITENAAVKAGVAYSSGNNVMYNASFNFEF